MSATGSGYCSNNLLQQPNLAGHKYYFKKWKACVEFSGDTNYGTIIQFIVLYSEKYLELFDV